MEKRILRRLKQRDNLVFLAIHLTGMLLLVYSSTHLESCGAFTTVNLTWISSEDLIL